MGCSKHSILLWALVVLSIAVIPTTSSASVTSVPHPLVLKYDFNFTIVDVIALNATRVALVVSYKEYSAVVVVCLEDPLEGPRIVQSYPLAGKVTVTAVDGYPSTRFAVGSDRGEIYLFKIDGGRLYQLLHLIQGADFRVLSLFVARAGGKYKLVATVGEGYFAGLCTNCFVYVFDEDLLGAAIISPYTITTATGYYKRIFPQIAIPAKVYTPSGYYYRADSVALFWAPYVDTIIADVNISHYVNATTTEPANGALIEISLLDPVTRARRVYGWNADSSGHARIPLPKGYLANITAIGMTRKFLLRENINTSAIVKRFRVEATIQEKASTDLAEEVYGLPFFAKYYIDFLDLTNAPTTLRVVKSLEKEFYPTVTRPHFIDYGNGYLVAMINKTYLEIYNLNYAFSLLPSTPVGVQYLGMTPVSIVDVLAYSKWDIVIGFTDGRIKHYKFNDLNNKYDFAQAVVTLGSLIRVLPSSGFSYFTFSTKGVQVVALTPFQLPILRVGFQAEFYVEDLVSASSLPGAELIALATPSKLYVVMNMGPAIESSTPINLNNYVAPSIIVKIRPPAAQERVNGSKVVLGYEIEGKKKEITREYIENNVTFTNIIPGVKYSILVVPPRNYILNYTTTLEVPYCEERCRNIVVPAELNYRESTLKLVLNDEFGGALLGRLKVVIDGITYSYAEPEGLSIKLLYGDHDIRIESLDRYYLSYSTVMKMEKDTILTLVLKRMRYNLSLVIVDGLTRSAADPRLFVYINGSAYLPTRDSTLSVTVPAGATNITVIPSRELVSVYSRASIVVTINKSVLVDIVMDRVIYNLTVAALDELTRREVSIKASVYINGTEVYRGLLPRAIRLPYAYYSIEVYTIEEHASIYSTGITELILDSDKTAQVLVFRKVYILDLVFRDKYSGKPVVPLRVLLNGSLYSTLMAPVISFPLRAASYAIRVEPVEEHQNSYIPVERTIELASNSRLVIDIVRRNYTLTLKLADTSVRGYLEGRFRIDLNTTVTVIVDGPTAARGFNVSVPYGKYVLTVTPVDAFERIYTAPSPATINIFSNSSHTARLSRKLLTITLIAVNDLEERVGNAYIQVVDPSTGLELSSIYTNDDGEARMSVPAGAASINVMKGGYQKYTEYLYLDRDTTLTPQLRPTLVTFIGRFAHIIALAVVAVAVIIIALKVKTKLAERLTTAEEVF